MAYCIEEFNSEFNGMEIVWTDNVQYDFPVMTCNNSAGISTNDRWIKALQQPTADQLKIFKTKSDHVCTSFFNTIWIKEQLQANDLTDATECKIHKGSMMVQ